MNRRNFIQSVGATIAALLPGTIDKRGTPVVQCNQDEPWRVDAVAYPIKAHDGQIRTTCDYKPGDAIRIVFDGQAKYYRIVSVATEIIGEIRIGLASPRLWLPLIRG